MLLKLALCLSVLVELWTQNVLIKANSLSYHHAMIRNFSLEKEERGKVGGKGQVVWDQLSSS